MLARTLLQTSLVLWLAQQTLQGGVKPQSVSWGRVLPARGVGVGVKPGVAGALGALGSRYGSKAMKTGNGRYPGAQLGVGGYRSLGLGGRAGLKQGAYGAQGPYGASLGTGMPLGTGLTNGMGLGLGQAGKHAYGAGLGTLPGYGALPGNGYPGARSGPGLWYPTGQRAEQQIPGVSAADLGGPELAARGGESYEPMVLKRKSTTGRGATLAAGGVRQQLPLKKDIRSLSSASSRGTRNYLSAAADRQGVRDLGLVTKGTNGLRIHGTVAVENRSHGSLNLQVQGRGSRGPVIPHASGTQSLGIASVEGQEAKGFTAGSQEAKRIYHDAKEPKALSVPRQTERSNRATCYLGGAGNHLGAGLGPGGYGAGLGQGAYLGGAAGKLGGYGEGATGYLGAGAGNGYGYGNGYSDGYGAGLGYPAELADGAENKAGKSQVFAALGAGGYAGQVQGAYGALGAGLESTGGKYGGGAAQVPYGNAPGIPAGLEGDGGYPYAAQQLGLGAEGAKTSNKYGAGAGYGAQQTGYGAQLGATQDALGEQAGKFGGVNGALGNGYKG
ncbi:fibroin heavy chain-like [Seriola dumerili]|uniref:fibroin heavy chain-like n=1 Tax=Seriola dumerili TaxID=41447 RepID=UPI000BBE33BB|nr:fibroin heavy chain-like [Seriola dumerili]